MKPIAIFRHSATEGPGYFATFLEQRRIPWRLVAIDRGEAVPERADAFSGLCLMGGPMSVNDPLPWVADVCALIRDGDRRGIPAIGHCLGGQLISKALGGSVTKNAQPEIGWSTVSAERNASARFWLGDSLDDTDGTATVFQWHGETFSLPEGGELVMGNAVCRNQIAAFGPHLALQCHIEMTLEMIEAWCRAWAAEVRGLDALPASVQTPEAMLREAPSRLPQMRRLADRLYAVWVSRLKVN